MLRDGSIAKVFFSTFRLILQNAGHHHNIKIIGLLGTIVFSLKFLGLKGRDSYGLLAIDSFLNFGKFQIKIYLISKILSTWVLSLKLFLGVQPTPYWVQSYFETTSFLTLHTCQGALLGLKLWNSTKSLSFRINSTLFWKCFNKMFPWLKKWENRLQRAS